MLGWPPLAQAAIDGRPDVEVMGGGWGGAQPAEIRAVIAAVIQAYPAPAAPSSLVIQHRFGGPQIQYDRDSLGRIVVFLSARDDRWYQYVYQFAHEYCHLQTQFDRKQKGDEIVREHQWFEEALCETASLYAVRRLAMQWCSVPPAPLTRAAAVQLSRYARQLMEQQHRRLPPHTALRAWYASHQARLREDPYLRQENELVAVHLLPLFEADPQNWQVLAYLNLMQPAPGQSFAAYLTAWRSASPPALRPLVIEIETLFLGPETPSTDRTVSGEPVNTRDRPPSAWSGCGS